MTDNDIVEFRDFKFNHYMHHFDEDEYIPLDEESEYLEEAYEDLFWEN